MNTITKMRAQYGDSCPSEDGMTLLFADGAEADHALESVTAPDCPAERLILKIRYARAKLEDVRRDFRDCVAEGSQYVWRTEKYGPGPDVRGPDGQQCVATMLERLTEIGRPYGEVAKRLETEFPTLDATAVARAREKERVRLMNAEAVRAERMRIVNAYASRLAVAKQNTP